MPGVNIPYRWITGLTEVQQREIERDFLAVIEQINNLGTFDAVINPASSTDAPNHVYKNLSDLLANETWLPTRTFSVAVHQQEGTSIVETTDPNSMTGKGDLVLFGISKSPSSPWEWNTLNCDSTQYVFFHNLAIANIGANF